MTLIWKTILKIEFSFYIDTDDPSVSRIFNF